MKPLAFRIRPKTFDDIVGQEHLVSKNGVIRKMIDKNKLFSIILYGPPGTGKTSISNVIASYYALNSFEFNASCDNKNKLKEIVDQAKYYSECLLIIDEIHRMKKDIQDFLLPYLENGSVIIIGLTTSNPYISINPAIRSRCHIYQLHEIKLEDIKQLLKKTIENNEEFQKLGINDEIINYIANASGCEIRTALNMLEMTSLLDSEDIVLKNVEQLIGKKALRLDKNDSNYYDLLSAFIKSIRGSDPDAAVHYLARLCTLEDLDMICRRLLISAYEDIGLGNPQIVSRIYAAVQSALYVGLPEARIPLSFAAIDLATSPKSNSCYMAINEAMSDYENIDCGPIPPHILNREIKADSSIYKYPHDFENGYVPQQYLPDNLLGKKYFKPKGIGSYEKALISYMQNLKK